MINDIKISVRFLGRFGFFYGFYADVYIHHKSVIITRPQSRYCQPLGGGVGVGEFSRR